ncbi:hypothetical protein NGE86_005248, partial [Escherichia coli]|nr:hypothetical protein [Escherichia coli]
MAKYIFIARNTIPLANPAGLVIYRIAKALSNLKHNVEIFSLNKPSGEQQIPKWLTENDDIHVNGVNLTKKNILFSYLKFLFSLSGTIKKEL